MPPVTREKSAKERTEKKGKWPETATATPHAQEGRRSERAGVIPRSLSAALTDPTQIPESKPSYPRNAIPKTNCATVCYPEKNPKARAETMVCRDDVMLLHPDPDKTWGCPYPRDRSDPSRIPIRIRVPSQSEPRPKDRHEKEEKLACRENDEKEESSTRLSASQNVGVVEKGEGRKEKKPARPPVPERDRNSRPVKTPGKNTNPDRCHVVALLRVSCCCRCCSWWWGMGDG